VVAGVPWARRGGAPYRRGGLARRTAGRVQCISLAAPAAAPLGSHTGLVQNSAERKAQLLLGRPVVEAVEGAGQGAVGARRGGVRRRARHGPPEQRFHHPTARAVITEPGRRDRRDRDESDASLMTAERSRGIPNERPTQDLA
jgi:hypothetical protein